MVAPIEKLPEIRAESETGFVDLVFRVTDHKALADGSQRLSAAGIHHGREVGFELVLSPSWKRGRLAKDIPLETSTGVLSYRRIGPESDVFLQVLDELYGAKLSPKTMANETAFTAISLKGDPANLAGGPAQIKLFYEKGGEDKYAEFYTDIDLATRTIEVHEKDEAYRKQIVQALRGY